MEGERFVLVKKWINYLGGSVCLGARVFCDLHMAYKSFTSVYTLRRRHHFPILRYPLIIEKKTFPKRKHFEKATS